MSQDLRKYANQTNVRLIVGGILVLFIVGIGLIYIFYDGRAAMLGLLCMILGLSPLLLIWLMLWVIGWIAKRANQE